MTRIAVLALALAAAGCASQPAQQQAAANPDELVCRKEKVTGQNRPERVCMTRAEREARQNAAQEGMIDRGGGATNRPADRAVTPN